jgi:hypothetical protein
LLQAIASAINLVLFTLAAIAEETTQPAAAQMGNSLVLEPCWSSPDVDYTTI